MHRHRTAARLLYFMGGVLVVSALIFLVLAAVSPWMESLVKLGIVSLSVGIAMALVGDRMMEAVWIEENRRDVPGEEFWHDQ